jgi:hypothetical protein
MLRGSMMFAICVCVLCDYYPDKLDAFAPALNASDFLRVPVILRGYFEVLKVSALVCCCNDVSFHDFVFLV